MYYYLIFFVKSICFVRFCCCCCFVVQQYICVAQVYLRSFQAFSAVSYWKRGVWKIGNKKQNTVNCKYTGRGGRKQALHLEAVQIKARSFEVVQWAVFIPIYFQPSLNIKIHNVENIVLPFTINVSDPTHLHKRLIKLDSPKATLAWLLQGLEQDLNVSDRTAVKCNRGLKTST